MIPFDVVFDPTRWDLRKKEVTLARPYGVMVCDNATVKGHPSVMIRIDLDGDKTIMAETTARLFCITAKAIMAKYPRLLDEPN